MLRRKEILLGLFLLSINCSAAFADSLSADEIVKRANHAALYQGQDGKGKAAITITDKQGFVRKRLFTMLRKDEDERDLNQKHFVFFEEPADVRKMVFMVHKQAKQGKDDARWLYMPSLDLVKRIAASDKRTSFVGSDFLYEDISGRNPSEDTHELIKTTDSLYIVKNVPKNPSAVEFAYYIASIDKETFLPMKIEYYKEGNRLSRVVESETVERVEADENGQKVVYPTITKSVAKDIEARSQSEMVFSDMRYNIGLSDDLFSERYLRKPPREATR